MTARFFAAFEIRRALILGVGGGEGGVRIISSESYVFQDSTCDRLGSERIFFLSNTVLLCERHEVGGVQRSKDSVGATVFRTGLFQQWNCGSCLAHVGRLHNLLRFSRVKVEFHLHCFWLVSVCESKSTGTQCLDVCWT